MTSPKCHRCGTDFEPRRAGDDRCIRCSLEVAQLIATDAARRSRVIFRPGDVTPYSGQKAL